MITQGEIWLPICGYYKEIWNSVPDYQGLYEVSNWGNVRSLDRIVTDRRSTRQFCGQILKPFFGRDDRPQVRLSKNGKHKTFHVSTLVLEAFVGPRPYGQECRHFPDPDPTNNNLTNLQWGTPEENAVDKIVHGSNHGPKGEQHGLSKLTDEKARAIRDDPRSSPVLAKLHGVSRTTINDVKSGRTWKHI